MPILDTILLNLIVSPLVVLVLSLLPGTEAKRPEVKAPITVHTEVIHER